MLTSTVLLQKTRDDGPDPEPVPNRGGETSGGGDTPPTVAASGEREAISVAADGETDEMPPTTTTTSFGEGERKGEEPPTDDVCPICFGDFDIPCRASCGHWYCGSCILQYWNFHAPLQPCKCPMCSQRITRLIPEASLSHRHQAEIIKVLRNVRDYNRLFVGGISGFMLKFLAAPLFMKRMFWEMLNPDRPSLRLHKIRSIALILGILYSIVPLDFLQLGRRNIIYVFDNMAFALSFILYLVSLYLRRRRERNFRALQNVQEGELLH